MSRTSDLHLFSLPPELLQVLTQRSLVSREDARPEVSESPSEQRSATGQRACNICLGASFTNIDDQRTHFRSDWHRYNVKIRLTGGKPVNEDDFNILIESLEDSLSGSASSSEDEDESDTDAVANLVSRTRIKSRPSSPTSTPTIPLSALAWFHAPPATQIGIYRSIFSAPSARDTFLGELQQFQKVVPEGRKWAMFMVAGGHFAGVVARVSRPDDAHGALGKGKQRKQVPDLEILLHKTFHRYTTRRKQGGSQSLNDNAKGYAKSAGALLRRYGEQALRDDIRKLIEEWAEEISSCERIWLRASGANRRIFMDYEGAVISKGDERLRTFPFPTRRPTQAELSRCLIELTRVKVTHFTEDELKLQEEAYLASLPKPRQIPTQPTPPTKPEKKAPPKLSKDEEALKDKWSRLLDMVRKGRLDTLKTFWEREGENMGGVDASPPGYVGEKFGTILQVASSAGQAEIVTWLLNDLRADPTVPVPRNVARDTDIGEESSRPSTPSDQVQMLSGRTAYDVASTKAVRDVFRRAAGEDPDMWDWLGAGHVPSILSKDMVDERDAKKKDRRKGLKEKIKQRETRERNESSPVREEVKEETVPVTRAQPKGGPQRLGGAPTASDGIAGLTPEMRARIERERRARAVEARLKALGGH